MLTFHFKIILFHEVVSEGLFIRWGPKQLYRILPNPRLGYLSQSIFFFAWGVTPMATKMKWNFFWPDSIFATIVQVHSFVFLLPSIDQRFQKFVPRCFAGRIICTRLIFAPPHPGPTIEPPLFLIAQFAFWHPLFFFAMAIKCSLNYQLLNFITMCNVACKTIQSNWVTWVGAKLYFW